MSPADLKALQHKRSGSESASELRGPFAPEGGSVPAKHCAKKAAELLLQSVGEDIDREGLRRTPARFAKAMKELTAGYAMTVSEAVGEGVFEAEGGGLVSVGDVTFYSMCEHHLLPFWGKASVAYYPAKKILGLSKIPRIVNLYAKRFQVQERLTRQIAEAVVEAIAPRAVAVRVTACHMCMMMRGVEEHDSLTTSEYALGGENLSASELSRLWASF